MVVTAQTEEPGDMQNISLDSVVVTGHQVPSPLSSSADGTVLWDMKMMNEMPKILGNADPIHYTQLLPSVQTNNEYDSGLHIQGCDNTHNMVSIDGVPLYNVAHLMGFFSVFNASHYSALQLQSTAKDASYANRLGGFLTMNLPHKVQERPDGEFSVGLISSQGTVRLPLNGKHQLNVSLRASYLNLFYSQWLKMDGNTLRYSFYDTNLTYLYTPNNRNTFLFDFYLGNDAGRISMDDYSADLDAEWGNHSTAVHWIHEGKRLRMKNTLYNTRFHNRYSLDMKLLRVALPSDICDYGIKNDMTLGCSHFGIDATYHVINPQKPNVDGSFFNPSANAHFDATKAFEASLFFDISLSLHNSLTLQPGIRTTAYTTGGSTHYSLDPSTSLTWQTTPCWSNRLGFASRHQYLLQTGIHSLGLPTTFWISTATFGIPVQRQQSLNLISDVKLAHGRYCLSVELYYKWMQHQQEYFGSFYDFINTSYDIRDMLHHGRGRNYGFNIILNKLKGSLKGWLSYSCGRSQRQFTDMADDNRWYPANHERIHEINAVATQEIGRRWSLGITTVYAMGTPFTAPRNFLMLNGNIITNYGEYNANRLKSYFRIDLSANYRFNKQGKKESGLNISVYNLSYSSNYISYFMKVHNDQFYYKGISFLTRILPSISYYRKF